MGTSFICDVLLVHQSSSGTAGPAEELEGDQGLQERCLPSAQGTRREGSSLASTSTRSRAHQADQGAGRLHWRGEQWPVQGGHLSVLSPRSETAALCFLSCVDPAGKSDQK